MLPEQVPVLTADDILISDKDFWNDDHSQSTPTGWLKRLFLMDVALELWPSPTANDRAHYDAAVIALKKEIGITTRVSWSGDLELLTWEETATPAKQAKAFNETMKSLGYTEVEYEQ